MNGDFVSSNDLAYIYDPNDSNTPQYLREGIQAILDNPEAEKSVKDYIRKNYGKVAERNGGVNGFYGTFDLRLNKNFKIYKTHSIEASIDFFNFLNIYSIKSFDAEKKQYVYNVNKNTGVSNMNGNPWQIQIGVRYKF